jgi:CheY-like chemotaxis protein
MRKVLEITFASPDFKIVTASSPDAALDKLKSDKPDLVVCDITLEPKNGYDLCKAIKTASPAVPVLLLSSKQNPYDQAKGTASLADDHMDKPFDTQQMIDKVKKMLSGQPAVAAAPAAAPAPAAAAAPKTAPLVPAATPVAAKPAATPPVAPAQPVRAKTLIYSAGQPIPQNAPAAAAPVIAPAATKPVVADKPAAAAAATPAAGSPLQAKSPFSSTVASPGGAPQAAPAAAPVAVQLNGQMSAKLAEIGLTPAQVDAVLALSREVVERVVWEVVPVLAETIIKEELSRLTK